MDSNNIAELVGNFQSQVEALHQCRRHAQEPLEFRARRVGLWKAQGEKHWYQISQVQDRNG